MKGQELEGVDWHLLNFRTPTAVTSAIVGADVTATFAAGKLTGTAGATITPPRTRAGTTPAVR